VLESTTPPHLASPPRWGEEFWVIGQPLQGDLRGLPQIPVDPHFTGRSCGLRPSSPCSTSCGRLSKLDTHFKFFMWHFQLSITALIFYSFLIGGAIVAVLALPKLVSKSFHVRSFNREIHKLKEKILELQKRHFGGSQIE
jgi:hypothetical protein